MKFIHMIYPVIGIMLALMLCITPVAAVSATPVATVSATPVATVSADDFEIVTESVEDNVGNRHNTYTYLNKNNQSEVYTYIKTFGTIIMHSLVTIKPAKIPDAPTMVVNTGSNNIFHNEHERIYLPRSVDEWEIKYYSNSDSFSQPDPKYLKCAGVVNLNELIESYFMRGLWFEEFIKKGFYLELSQTQCLYSQKNPSILWYIPDVD